MLLRRLSLYGYFLKNSSYAVFLRAFSTLSYIGKGGRGPLGSGDFQETSRPFTSDATE